MNRRILNREGANGTKGTRRLFLLFFLLFAFFAPSRLILAFAQGDAPDEQTYRIAKMLNCPTCAGRNLADCPTETCTQWKAEIKAQLDAGKNSEAVLAYFQDRFGPTVLQEPPKTGVTAPLWAMPVGAAMVFVGLAVLAARRNARRGTTLATDTTASAILNVDPFVAELENEIKKQS